MKLCIFVKNYKQPWNEGVKNNIKQIASRLSGNHEIFFIGISDETAEIQLQEGTSYLFKSPYYKTKYRYLFYPIGFLYLLINSIKIIRNKKPDILLSSFGTSSLFILLIKLLSGVKFKIVQFIYNDWYSFKKVPVKVWLLEHFNQMLFNNKFLSKMSLMFADRIIATSYYLKKELESMGYQNVVYIPTGVDINEYLPNKEIRKKYQENMVLAYIGHLIHAKGLSLLLEAVSKLLDERNIRLIIASSHSGTDEKILQNLSHTKITLFGTVRAKDIYNSCDLLVYPRRFSFQTVIYPNIILEAMSCATPVLTTRLPAIDEIITDKKNGYLVKPNDVKDLKSKILEIIKNKDALEKIGLKARAKVESKFDWNRIVPEIEKELKLSISQSKSKKSVYEIDKKINEYEKRRFGSYGGGKVNKKELNIISELSESADGYKIMELGCGTGRLTKLISKQSHSLVSVDRSELMLKKCRKNVGNVNLICSDVKNLAFKKNIFDECISLRLVHHFNYQAIEEVLKETKRYLKDKSVVIFNTTNIFSLSILSAWTNLFPRSYGYHHYSNEKRIAKILRDNKFEIIENRRLFFIPSFLFRLLKNKKYLVDLLWRVNEGLEKTFPSFCSMVIWKVRNIS